MRLKSSLLITAAALVVSLGAASSSQAASAHQSGPYHLAQISGKASPLWTGVVGRGHRLPSGNRIVVSGCMRCIAPPSGYLGAPHCMNMCIQ